MTRHRLVAWAVCAGTVLFAAGTTAQEPDAGSSDAEASNGERLASTLQCAPRTTRMDKFRYLRALSLDLRGTVPTAEEYRELEGQSEVPEATIDEMLQSEAFGDRVVRWHRKLMWNNVRDVRFFPNGARLRTHEFGEGGPTVYWSPARAIRERGKRVPCLNEPAQYDDGELVKKEKSGGSWQPDTDGSCEDPDNANPCREGWVEVQPYWSPDETVRVCGVDARDSTYTESGTSCEPGNYDCGCGENLRKCVTRQTRRTIKRAMADQVEQLVRWVVMEDRPYIDLFRTERAFFNGPLVHYWRHMAGDYEQLRTDPPPYDLDRLPELEFPERETWRQVTVGEQHAGILTAPAYLLRFSRDRQRANHFYKKFLCEPFEPPESGLEIDTSGEEVEPDLQKRSGCQYCHSRLEPAAAHWGRWREVGAGYLDRRRYPASDPKCRRCANSSTDCSERCKTHYITDLTARYKQPYAGQLESMLFRRDRHRANVRSGPAHLAARAIGDNRLPRCAVRTRAEALLGRALGSRDAAWVDRLVQSFVDDGFSYRNMVRAIVTSSKYRKVR